MPSGRSIDSIADLALTYTPGVARVSSAIAGEPELARRVVAETTVRGLIGYRILLDGEKVGALNLFSDTADAFTTTSVDQAAVLASFASVAVMTVRAQNDSANLERALGTSREIGKAVGLLMAAHKVDDDEAFELLRKTSQDLNIKLATLAEEVVQGQRVQYVANKHPQP